MIHIIVGRSSVNTHWVNRFINTDLTIDIFIYDKAVLYRHLHLKKKKKKECFYKVLGLTKPPPEMRTADIQRLIRKAFHRQAMKHHPDRGGDAETFINIIEAYEVLSNERNRKIYNIYGHAGVRQAINASKTDNPNAYNSVFTPSNGGEGVNRVHERRQLERLRGATPKPSAEKPSADKSAAPKPSNENIDSSASEDNNPPPQETPPPPPVQQPSTIILPKESREKTAFSKAYLAYILDYYDMLPPFVSFIHSEQNPSLHTAHIIKRLIEAARENKPFYNINDKKATVSIVIHPLYDDILQWYQRYIQNYIPIINNRWIYSSGGQFSVRRESIRQFPKVFYQEIYNWCKTVSNEHCNQILNVCWDLFWNRPLNRI